MTTLKISLLSFVFLCFLLSSCSLLKSSTVRFEGTSMLPAIKDGQRVKIQKLDQNSHQQLARGDIVIFLFPQDESRFYIKRLIGLPGDRVEIRDGEVWLNGAKLDEQYLDPKLNRANRSQALIEVPARSYYVLGDNRDNSSDSRIWGLVAERLIVGKVVL